MNLRHKKQINSRRLKEDGILYCYVPYCRKCRRLLNDEYAIRFRRSIPRYECIPCYLIHNNSIPKEQHRKYEPYATKYKEVLQWMR